MCVFVYSDYSNKPPQRKIHFKDHILIFIHFHDSCYIPFPLYLDIYITTVLYWKLNADCIWERDVKRRRKNFFQQSGVFVDFMVQVSTFFTAFIQH